uniref:Uncharacterized protein n=1 Tax=Cacopsylla melanoneura TaxID=428564 RepID=A0A8D9F8B4_9HEMI
MRNDNALTRIGRESFTHAGNIVKRLQTGNIDHVLRHVVTVGHWYLPGDTQRVLGERFNIHHDWRAREDAYSLDNTGQGLFGVGRAGEVSFDVVGYESVLAPADVLANVRDPLLHATRNVVPGI